MRFLSYAQNLEDVRLARALWDVREGRYLDIGAQDPRRDSVSRGFYEAGWRGVHVEPLAEYAQALRADRDGEIVLACIVGTAKGEAAFHAIPGSGLSTQDSALAKKYSDDFTVETRSLPVRSLDNILGEMGDAPIHWMKIDVEGAEGDVLQSWQNAALRPWILCIEAVHPITQAPAFDWEPLLVTKGYHFAGFDGLNRFYVHSAQAARAEKLAVPPNIFDDYALAKGGMQTRKIEADYDAQINLLRSQAARLQSDLQKNADDAIAHYSSVIANKDAAIEKADTALAHSKSVITNKDAAIAKADNALAHSRDVLANKNAAITKADTALAHSKSVIANKDAAIAKADNALAHSRDVLANKNAAIAKANTALAHSKQVLANKDAAIAAADEALAHYERTLAHRENILGEQIAALRSKTAQLRMRANEAARQRDAQTARHARLQDLQVQGHEAAMENVSALFREMTEEQIRKLDILHRASDSRRQAHVAGVETHAARLAEELARYQAALAEIQGSTSWRLTAPVRRGVSLARRSAGFARRLPKRAAGGGFDRLLYMWRQDYPVMRRARKFVQTRKNLGENLSQIAVTRDELTEFSPLKLGAEARAILRPDAADFADWEARLKRMPKTKKRDVIYRMDGTGKKYAVPVPRKLRS